MKKKIVIFIILCFFIMIAPVFAYEDIHYSKTLDITDVIDVVGYSDGYVLLKSNGELNKYNLDGNVSKKLDNFEAMGILKYGDSFIVYGVSENLVNVYILDSNLRVVHNSSLDIMVNGSFIKGYVYDNKVYFILSLDNVISSTKVVLIDKSFNIEIGNLSDIEELKDVLKSDYYLYDDGSLNKSVLLNNYNYLMGNNSDNKGILKRVEDNLLKEDEIYSYNDIIVIGNNIVILGNNDVGDSLIVCDLNGNVISKLELEDGAIKLDKFNNYLVVVYSDKLLLYDYDLELIKEDSLFGTLNVDGDIVPYGEILVTAEANSGYEIEKIIVQSNTGELIELEKGKFIMPEDNVIVSVIYKEIVKNPETFDAIIWITLLAIVMIVVGRLLYVKLKWLK